MTSLCDYDFNDIFFSVKYLEDQDKQKMILFRGGEVDLTYEDLELKGREDLNQLIYNCLSINKDEFFMDFQNMRFRVTLIKDVNGSWYTLRRLMNPIPRLGNLNGMNSLLIKELMKFGKTSGLILLAGATGQGKTTTVSSLMMEYLLANPGNIGLTIEDPIELPLSGSYGTSRCFQIQVNNGDFATSIRSAMRQAPNYILLGEVRDKHASSEILRASINGHLVLTTIHAGSVVQAIESIVKFASSIDGTDFANQILADGILAVLHQKLTKDNLGKKKLEIESLFIPNDFNEVNLGMRSLIKEGKYALLRNNISKQREAMTFKK